MTHLLCPPPKTHRSSFKEIGTYTEDFQHKLNLFVLSGSSEEIKKKKERKAINSMHRSKSGIPLQNFNILKIHYEITKHASDPLPPPPLPPITGKLK